MRTITAAFTVFAFVIFLPFVWEPVADVPRAHSIMT
jgi:hypothetical protein